MKRSIPGKNHLSLFLVLLSVFFVNAGCGGGPGPVIEPPPPSSEIPETPAPEEPLPDLRITEIEVKPKPIVILGESALVRGTDYAIRARVVNKGEAQMKGAIAVSANYGCQGPGMGGTGGTFPVGEDGLSAPLKINISVSRSPGTCTFEFKVDPDNVTKEEDESNNVLEKTFTVQ